MGCGTRAAYHYMWALPRVGHNAGVIGRSIVLVLALAGCIDMGISRDRAIEIGVAEAGLDEVTHVGAVRQQYANPEIGVEGVFWAVTVEGSDVGCVPGGGGCGNREVEATYYIDIDTGAVVDGLVHLGPKQ